MTPSFASKTNRHVSQAAARKRHGFAYQAEMDLIGAEFRRLRLEKGLTIGAVAQAMGMRKYRICQIEHGMYIHFDLGQLYRLSAHYGVSHLDVLAVIPGTTFKRSKL